MKKIILFTIFLLGIVHNAHAIPFFADTIVDYSSGTGLDFTGDAHIARALGPADLVFITIGETGHMTFTFDDLLLVDGSGYDVRIYTTSHSIFN